MQSGTTGCRTPGGNGSASKRALLSKHAAAAVSGYLYAIALLDESSCDCRGVRHSSILYTSIDKNVNRVDIS
jgi:hypothetical protein